MDNLEHLKEQIDDLITLLEEEDVVEFDDMDEDDGDEFEEWVDEFTTDEGNPDLFSARYKVVEVVKPGHPSVDQIGTWYHLRFFDTLSECVEYVKEWHKQAQKSKRSQYWTVEIRFNPEFTQS